MARKKDVAPKEALVANNQVNITEQAFHIYCTFRDRITNWLKSPENAEMLFNWQCFLLSDCMDSDLLEEGMFHVLLSNILEGEANREVLLADENTFAFLKKILQSHIQYKTNIPIARLGIDDSNMLQSYIRMRFTASIMDSVENPSEKTQSTLLRNYFNLQSVKSTSLQ